MEFATCSARPLVRACTLERHAYQVDPYIGCAHLCHYCYALNTAETDWAQKILLYDDIERQLTEELENIPPQSIYMGWTTDPYQPCEAEFEQTRKVLEILQARGFTVSILTKSDLILRDLDILTAMNNASVSFSVAFNDEDTRKLLEADTIPTQARIKAMKECKKAGLHVSAMVCPVIPSINDPSDIIEQVKMIADRVWVYGLSILDESETNWQTLEGLLQRTYPDKYDDIRSAIFDKDNALWLSQREALLGAYSGEDFKLSVHF